MIELFVSVAMLAASLATVATMSSAIARQRYGSELRLLALEEADNVLERLTAEPWEAISTKRADDLGLAEAVASMLPDGELKLRVGSPQDRPTAKRIDVTIAWRIAGRRDQRVHLTTFVEGGAAP
jgi:hypothetical protein